MGDIEEDNIAKAEQVYSSICISYCAQSGEGRWEEVKPFENFMDALNAYSRAQFRQLEWWCSEDAADMYKYKVIDGSDMVAFNKKLKTYLLSQNPTLHRLLAPKKMKENSTPFPLFKKRLWCVWDQLPLRLCTGNTSLIERKKVKITMGHIEWFDIGRKSQTLSLNLLRAIENGECEEVKILLSRDLQLLKKLIESVESDAIEEHEIEKALAVWNGINDNYEMIAFRKTKKKEEVVVSSSVNTSPRSRGGEEEK